MKVFPPFKFQVHRVCWWMAHYGSGTPKRQYMWSNSFLIEHLDRGKLHMATWRKRHPRAPKTSKQYVSKDGKKWTATSALKRTEYLVCVAVVSSAIYTTNPKPFFRWVPSCFALALALALSLSLSLPLSLSLSLSLSFSQIYEFSPKPDLGMLFLWH